jgi:hypothetical protein
VCPAAGQQHGEQQHTCRPGAHQEPGTAAPAVAATSAQRGCGSHAPRNTGEPTAGGTDCDNEGLAAALVAGVVRGHAGPPGYSRLCMYVWIAVPAVARRPWSAVA